MAWLGSEKKELPQPSGIKVWSGASNVRKPYTDYNVDWTPQRALTEGLQKVTWVYRCVDAIASNAARLPVVFRKGDRWKGEPTEHEDLNRVLNKRANPGEDSFMFRYRLSGQVLTSKYGAFIEVVRDQGGSVAELRLLPPDQVEPIKDSRTFVKRYDVTLKDANGNTRVAKLPPENVVWIRKPHLFDPYAAMTPLEAAGVSIETDWLARIYNRNFLKNDGRPGGMVIIKGDVIEEDKEELQSRFRGDASMAGRITVVASTEGADFVDTAVTPRDAQYIEGRKNTKEEILMNFGVPETVLGNAAGRTFDNAEMERLIYWMETMMPHLELIMRPLDVLDDEDEDYVSFDLSVVDVLQRMDMKRREFSMRETDAGLTSIDEYREETGREPLADGRGAVIYRAKTKLPYLTTDGSDLPLPIWEDDENTLEGPVKEVEEPDPETLPIGRPEDDTQEEAPEEEPPEREDERPAPLANEPQKSEPVDSVAGEIEAQADYVLSLKVESKTMKIGDVTVDEADIDAFKAEMVSDFERESQVIEATAKRFLERQKAVVDQKLRGRKMRQYIAKRNKFLSESSGHDASPYHLSLKAAVEIVYDQAVWDDQLEEDMLPIITSTVEKYGKQMAEEMETDFDIEDAAVQAFIAVQLSRLLEMNNSTRHAVSEVLSAGALADSSVSEMADKLATEFDEMIAVRPEKIGLTEAVASINGGRHLAAVRGRGVDKTWVAVADNRVRPSHVAASGQTVPVAEKFVVGGAKMDFPGDPDGPPSEVVNCRCAVAYSSDSKVFF